MERIRWWLAGLRDAVEGSSDAKFVGAFALVALLAAGGYVAAEKVSQAGAGTGASRDLVRVVTTVREPVKTRIHGRTVIRWRVRRKVVQAQAQTVMQTETVKTPSGSKVITRPVVRYRVAYRQKVVTRNGKTRTVDVPQTVTASQTIAVTRTQTDVQTVTQPVTVTRTVTATSTVTQPGTTVTLPGTTVTVTLPGTTVG
jgi:hypothetical protein